MYVIRNSPFGLCYLFIHRLGHVQFAIKFNLMISSYK